MADLGLLLKDDLALAAFEGRKTVSRRPLGRPPRRIQWRQVVSGYWNLHVHWPNGESFRQSGVTATEHRGLVLARMLGPAAIRGAGTAEVGGRVWVRECFAPVHSPPPGGPAVLYRAGADHALIIHMAEAGDRWRPSIHMKKQQARTWGRITSVTPCDLSAIDDAEAKREGFETAGELKAALKALYPDARWFWRIEWERIETPEVRRAH